MADKEEAVVPACTSFVFCALDLHQPQGEQLLEKVRWTCPPQSTLWRRPWTRVVQVALVVTSVSRLAVRQARHVSARLVTTFPYAKIHGLGGVSCRDVTWRAKWNLGLNQVKENPRHLRPSSSLLPISYSYLSPSYWLLLSCCHGWGYYGSAEPPKWCFTPWITYCKHGQILSFTKLCVWSRLHSSKSNNCAVMKQLPGYAIYILTNRLIFLKCARLFSQPYRR